MDTIQLKELASLDLNNFVPPSENNVKYKIVIPFLNSFHYDDLKFEHGAQTSRIDINIEDKIIIETKALNQNLSNHVQQLSDYCGKVWPSLAILTNGQSFRIYSPQWRHKRLFSEKIIYKFELSELKDEELIKRLDLIIGYANYKSREYLENIEYREKELLSITQEIEELNNLKLSRLNEIEHEITEIKCEIKNLSNKLNSKDQERKVITYNKDPKITKLIQDYFVPEIEAQTPINSGTSKPKSFPTGRDFVAGEALILKKEKKGILAYGTILENGEFIVLKGSTVSVKPAPQFETSNRSGYRLRNKYLEDGTIDDNLVFTKDVTFSSISSAAGVIIGSSANGYDEWEKNDYKLNQ